MGDWLREIKMNNIDAFEKRIQALEGIVPLSVKFRRVRDTAKAPKPGAAGWRLFAANSVTMTGMGATVLVPTGLAFDIPPGYEAQVRPIPELNAKGLMVHFSAAPHLSELHVTVTCVDRMSYVTTIHAGECIAQLVLAPIPSSRMVEVFE